MAEPGMTVKLTIPLDEHTDVCGVTERCGIIFIS